jgi:conjugal transfer mating pair stabilization protein TraN
VSQNYIDNCAPLVQRGCGQVGSRCVDTMPDGTCDLYEQTYKCKVADGTSSTVLDCGGQVYCMNGNCIDASAPADQDFAKAVTGMEILREGGTYMDPHSLTLFNGSPGSCRVTLGIFNCCKSNTKGSGSTNSSMVTQLGISGAISVGSESIQYLGSSYAYDALFMSDSPSWLINGFSSIFGTGSSYLFNPSLSYFGVTFGYGAAPSSLSWSASMGDFYVGFDPVSFGIALAFYAITELMSCDQQEQILAMKKGQNLCVDLGSYCSKKVLKVCVQKKKGYCCYNSRLARIIAVAGRSQLHKSWGSASSPSCGGFTTSEIAKLDFSAIDFSEFTADVQKSISAKTPAYATERAINKINNYFNGP